MNIEVDRRFAHEQVREFQDGEPIFLEGDENRELYVIQKGSVVIRKKTSLGELELVRFQGGDFFGDMALLQGIPRFASAYAVGKTKLLILKPGGFLLKIRRDPTFAFEMLQQLSFRVKAASEKLLEAISKGGMQKEAVQEILHSVQGLKD